MPNIEIPSENPTFKENSSHIHTNIDTSKLKPDSNDDTLHFSKIAVLEAKFDALKSLVTREISNLANKLDSLSLVLNETSKTLGKPDASNSKLLQNNFEFLCKEILSKDILINYLLNGNTNYNSKFSYISEKSRENTAEITKAKCSTTTRTKSTK